MYVGGGQTSLPWWESLGDPTIRCDSTENPTLGRAGGEDYALRAYQSTRLCPRNFIPEGSLRPNVSRARRLRLQTPTARSREERISILPPCVGDGCSRRGGLGTLCSEGGWDEGDRVSGNVLFRACVWHGGAGFPVGGMWWLVLSASGVLPIAGRPSWQGEDAASHKGEGLHHLANNMGAAPGTRQVGEATGRQFTSGLSVWVAPSRSEVFRARVGATEDAAAECPWGRVSHPLVPSCCLPSEPLGHIPRSGSGGESLGTRWDIATVSPSEADPSGRRMPPKFDVMPVWERLVAVAGKAKPDSGDLVPTVHGAP